MKKRILSIIVCLMMGITTFAGMPMMVSALDTVETETDLPPAVNYTDAAPFLEPVEGKAQVQRKFALQKSVDNGVATAAQDTNNNGLITSKELAQNEEGEDILRLEAWTTGSKVTTTVSESVPTDIILVLDQSGSMNFCMYENCNSQYCSGKHNITTYTYKETTTISTDYNAPDYFYNDNGTYKQIYYCDGSRYYDCDEGWYTQEHDWNSHGGELIEPKTNTNPSGVQCYTRTQQSSYQQTFDKRINALSTAADSFVESVYEKAAGADKDLSKTEDNVDHRIAIVGFASENGTNTELLTVKGSNSSYNNGNGNTGSLGEKYSDSVSENKYKEALQDVSTKAGQTMVSNAVDALDANGATRVDLGIKMANNIFAKNPIGQTEKRNRVVIVFTDGSPTSGSNFESTVANNAIKNAQTAKSTAEEGYGATVYSIGIFGGADGSNPASLPNNDSTGSNQENRFMHLVSSNYPNATDMTTPGDVNANLKGNSYYLSANNSEALNDIFEQISSEIESGKPPITLTETAVVQDVISEQFQLPEGTKESDIKVYTAEYEAENSFKKPVEYNATIDISGDRNEIITVTNFDFTENWVGTESVNGKVTYRGNKLIIEIPIEVRKGFLGGNNVLTNAEGSGVYEDQQAVKDGDSIEEFDSPKTDVEIKDITVTAPDKNVYLLGSVSEEEIASGLTVKSGSVTLDMDPDSENYGLESWQNAYVTIGGNNSITDDSGLTNDTSYSATVKITPTTTGAATEKSGSDTGTIKVFRPELAFNEGNVYLGGTTPSEYKVEDHVASVVWKNGETIAPESMGNAPTLSYEFNNVNTEVTSTEDILVNAIVKIGDTDVTNHVVGDNPGFKLHVFSPYIQFSDSNVYYGNNVPTEFTGNTGTAVWKRGDVLADSVTMLGSEPDITCTYNTSETGAINTTNDIKVDVNAKAGNVAISEGNFAHVACGDSEILPEGAEFLLHVLTPSVNFKDSYVYYGDNAPSNFDANTGTVTWGKESIKAPTTIGNKPEVTMNYNYINTNDVVDGIIKVRDDIPVNVVAKAGEVEFPVDSIGHINCDGATTEKRVADAEFELHVKTCTLNITKNGILDVDHHAAGNGSQEERQTSLFDIYKDNETQPFMTVAINGNTADGEPETITGLPVGKYTVVERTDWSWRYKPSYNPDDNVTLKATKDTDTVNVINTRFTKDTSSVGWKWLNGGAYSENSFGLDAQ